MPLKADLNIDRVASLEETIDHFSSIDIGDRDALWSSSAMLRALANNRTFLARRIAEELKQANLLQQSNAYSSQVFFLGRGRNYFLRANFWPAADDSVVQASGPYAFFYHVPHDHNFDFLTVGYYGPGYISNFYEYDFDRVTGYVGEKVDLRFIERAALPEGRVMLYRTSVDIHEQLPPESFSISLNVVSDFAEKVASINQYMLNLRTQTIESLGNRNSVPLICAVAAYIGDEECKDILDSLSKSHPVPRGRFAAFQALTRLCPADAESIWRRAAADPAKHVSVQARLYLDRSSIA